MYFMFKWDKRIVIKIIMIPYTDVNKIISCVYDNSLKHDWVYCVVHKCPTMKTLFILRQIGKIIFRQAQCLRWGCCLGILH